MRQMGKTVPKRQFLVQPLYSGAQQSAFVQSTWYPQSAFISVHCTKLYKKKEAEVPQRIENPLQDL
jgi:hypothetical protein